MDAPDGGMEEFCRRYADSFQRWWDDLGDAPIVNMLKASRAIRDEG